jgi:hypothetical protein
MSLKTTISFAIQQFEGTHAVIPLLDGTSLIEMVSAFESEQGFDVAGGYGGLIPEWFKYGPLERYYLGDFDPDSYFVQKGGVYLLGCDCGEVGCGPLTAQIETSVESVKWKCFGQEHRPGRDYSGFGPFIFEADQYRKAVLKLTDDLSSLSATNDNSGG